jgi:hypothetical protein
MKYLNCLMKIVAMKKDVDAFWYQWLCEMVGFSMARSGPTKRAPDGWWAPRFELDSSEEFGSVS